MSLATSLTVAAESLAKLLAARRTRIVFAESCTAGLVAASVAQVAGVSEWLCGSAVTYRETTKTAWLDISPSAMREHNVVSEEIAREMALQVLRITPEATFSAAITGHLGPHAPPHLDGVTYIAVAERVGQALCVLYAARETLSASDRISRQQQAAQRVLEIAHDVISHRQAGS